MSLKYTAKALLKSSLSIMFHLRCEKADLSLLWDLQEVGNRPS